MSRVRDASGRFANGFARTADAILRSGADMHGRTFLNAPEPLSKMDAPEADPDGGKYRYAVAVRAVVRWSAGERPTRHVEVEYVDPAREHVVVREAPGRLGSTNGRVHVTAVEWGAVPRRIAVARGERRALDADADEHAAYVTCSTHTRRCGDDRFVKGRRARSVVIGALNCHRARWRYRANSVKRHFCDQPPLPEAFGRLM